MGSQAFVSSSRGEEYETNERERNEAAEAASRLLYHVISKCRESAKHNSLSPAPTTKTFNAVINAWAKSKSKDAGNRAEADLCTNGTMDVRMLPLVPP
jgi:hypothetical protein